jgi:hypothetical protein
MVIALLLLALAPVFVQDQDQEKEKEKARPPRRGDIVVARGCLRGSALENADLGKRESPDRFAGLVTYRLTGDKKTMEEIRKEHDGHADVITGELKTDPPTSTETRGTRIGKSRITIGIGASRGMGPERPPPMPVLRVTSFEHTGVNCR